MSNTKAPTLRRCWRQDWCQMCFAILHFAAKSFINKKPRQKPWFLCGACDKLIQFYSFIHCNTFRYIASFFKVCIVQPHKASFYPQTRRFWYNFGFESCPLGIDPNFNRSLFLGYIPPFGWGTFCGTYLVSHFSTIKWVPCECIFIRLTFFK